MNSFERTPRFSRALVGVNVEALQKLTDQAAENFKRYLEINQDLVRRLPAVYGLDGLFELLQDYGHSVWQEACRDLRARGEILHHAVEKSGELVPPRVFASGNHQAYGD